MYAYAIVVGSVVYVYGRRYFMAVTWRIVNVSVYP